MWINVEITQRCETTVSEALRLTYEQKDRHDRSTRTLLPIGYRTKSNIG